MPVEPAPDPRWQIFIGGLDAGGHPAPMTYGRLHDVPTGWPTTRATPEGVEGLLATSRRLWPLAWFEYDLLVVSAYWSILAVEAALREVLAASDKPAFGDLIKQAVRVGVLDAEWAERLDAGRLLRNSLAHARQQGSWTVGMSAPILRASHQVVTVLYPDGDVEDAGSGRGHPQR